MDRVGLEIVRLRSLFGLLLIGRLLCVGGLRLGARFWLCGFGRGRAFLMHDRLGRAGIARPGTKRIERGLLRVGLIQFEIGDAVEGLDARSCAASPIAVDRATIAVERFELRLMSRRKAA